MDGMSQSHAVTLGQFRLGRLFSATLTAAPATPQHRFRVIYLSRPGLQVQVQVGTALQASTITSGKYYVSNLVVTRRADLSFISLYISASSKPKTSVPSPIIYTWFHPQCLLSRTQVQEGALHVDEEGCALKVSEVSNSPQVPFGWS